MLNRVILMGRLTADPELRQTTSGISTCRFSVAVNRRYKSKDSEEQQADFIRVTAWRQTAEFICRYFSKGQTIIIEGSLRNNDYTDSNGVKHYSMDVQADSVNFGGSKKQNEESSKASEQQTESVQSKPTGRQTKSAMPEALDGFEDFADIIAGDDPPF